MQRRNLILAFGALVGLAGLQSWRRRPGKVALGPHPHVPGFRTLTNQTTTSVSGGAGANIALIGIETEDTRVPPDIAAEVAADPLAALYGSTPSPAVAYFTDIRCPICRPLERSLDTLATEIPALHRVTHEYPVFGESSTLAARALIAIGPDRAPQLRARLQRAPVALNEDILGQLISGLGVDAAPILDALHSTQTTRRLHQSRALAELFGFYGTPALVIGRTTMLGAQPLGRLREIARQEFNL